MTRAAAQAADRRSVDWEREHKKCMALIELARRNGTHSDKGHHFCSGCNQWVGGIYYITFGGVELCAACADKIDQGPKADELRASARSGGSGARR